jgi:hypothetical protein
MSKEIKTRVFQAWKTFWVLKFILLDKSLNRKFRLKALDTCIMPVLLYASQIWSITTKHKNNIEVCQGRMVRKILKHPATRIVHAEECHTNFTAQMEMGRTCRKASPHQKGRGKRSRDRTSTRWANYFNKLVGPHWSQVVRDRNEWKVLGNQLNAVNHSYGPAQRVSL